eukprot:1143104-Pelagomonas_calceolata.AAC.1
MITSAHLRAIGTPGYVPPDSLRLIPVSAPSCSSFSPIVMLRMAQLAGSGTQYVFVRLLPLAPGWPSALIAQHPGQPFAVFIRTVQKWTHHAPRKQ